MGPVAASGEQRHSRRFLPQGVAHEWFAEPHRCLDLEHGPPTVTAWPLQVKADRLGAGSSADGYPIVMVAAVPWAKTVGGGLVWIIPLSQLPLVDVAACPVHTRSVGRWHVAH